MMKMDKELKERNQILKKSQITELDSHDGYTKEEIESYYLHDTIKENSVIWWLSFLIVFSALVLLIFFS